MIQLFNSATDEAVATCGSVLADVSELKSNKADKLYQQVISIPNSNIITLREDAVIYTKDVSSNTTFVFDTSNLTKQTDFITFELRVNMTTASSITFPSNVVWANGEAPDLSQTGHYFFAFRTFPSSFGLDYWFASLQGKWW